MLKSGLCASYGSVDIMFQFLLIDPAETWHNALYSWNIQLQFENWLEITGQILSSTTEIYF
jgi:hypothetical protein